MFLSLDLLAEKLSDEEFINPSPEISHFYGKLSFLQSPL